VEWLRLQIIDLQEQRVSIGVSVEIAIVSVLREVIVSGLLETDWRQILAVCLFLATPALLMVVRVWLLRRHCHQAGERRGGEWLSCPA